MILYASLSCNPQCHKIDSLYTFKNFTLFVVLKRTRLPDVLTHKVYFCFDDGFSRPLSNLVSVSTMAELS